MQVARALLSAYIGRFAIAALALLFAGCQPDKQAGVIAHQKSVDGLVLLLSDVNDRVGVTIANTGERDVRVRRELLPGGARPELVFEFDGIAPNLVDAPLRGQTEVSESPDAMVTVEAERMVGILFFKEDLRQLYSLERNKCYQTRVFYQRALDTNEASVEKIVANAVQLCF